jgi:hypothetical protein
MGPPAPRARLARDFTTVSIRTLATSLVTPALMVALFAGAFLASLTAVSDGDIFWHLAAGREMIRRRAWLHTDSFTLSAAGRPWVDIHWLFQLLVYGIDAASGLAGVVVAKALVVATGAVVLAMAVGRSGGPVARALFAPAMIGVLFVARQFLLARPVIVTLLMLALFFAALEAIRTGRRRPLLWLPFLQIVWTNCQGLAVLGPAMIGAYLIGARLPLAFGTRRWRWPFAPEGRLPVRPLALTLVLCIAASFATPYGGAGAALPARLLARITPVATNVFATQVAENVSPFVLERTAPAQIFHFKWYLAALAVCLALAERRLYLSHVALLCGSGALALMANRNVLLFYWVATPIAVLAVAPRVQRLLTAWKGRAWSATPAIALGVALCSLLGIAAGAAHREPTITEPTPFHFPTESTRRLVAAGARGPVFAPDHVGGYLAFTAPGLVPYIDTRLLLHSADEYAAYLSDIEDGARFDALAGRSGFRYVILTTAYPDRYLGLVQHLAANPLWDLAFTDGAEVLFTRRDPEAGDDLLGSTSSAPTGAALSADTILAQLAIRFSRWPERHQAARLQLARLLIVLGELDQAQRVLSTVNGRVAVQLRARAHLVAGELGAAEGLTRTLLLDDPRDVRSLALMAQISALDGRPGDAALGWLRRALEVDPYDAEARRLVESLAATTGQEGVRGSPAAVGSHIRSTGAGGTR